MPDLTGSGNCNERKKRREMQIGKLVDEWKLYALQWEARCAESMDSGSVLPIAWQGCRTHCRGSSKGWAVVRATRRLKHQIRWVFVVHLNNSNISYIEQQKWYSTSRCTTPISLLTHAARHHSRIANPADRWRSAKKNVPDLLRVTLYIWAAESEPAGEPHATLGPRVWDPCLERWCLLAKRKCRAVHGAVGRSVSFRSALACRPDHSLASTQTAEFRQAVFQDAPKSVWSSEWRQPSVSRLQSDSTDSSLV